MAMKRKFDQQIDASGDENNVLFDLLWKSFFEAMNDHSPNLLSTVMHMKGGSGRRYRRFVNNIVRRMIDLKGDARYLEVGSWFGSTICSAMCGNIGAKGFAVDNWSQFGGPKQDFISNVEKFCPKGREVLPER